MKDYADQEKAMHSEALYEEAFKKCKTSRLITVIPFDQVAAKA